MKIRDARAIINSKKRKLQLQKNVTVTTNTRIVDARQILKSKRRKESNKSKFKSADIPAALVKKELEQLLKSSADRKDINKRANSQSAKHVEFASSGILTVTSKGSSSARRRNPQKSSQIADSGKLLLNNRKSIVVIKPNERELSQRKSAEEQMDIDQEDDLENMTLEDFPDIKSLPRGLTSSSKSSSLGQRTPWRPGFSSIANSMQGPVKTMVADTVESMGSSSSQQQQQQQQQGYTVFVTNLHDSVTPEDIVELFGDVGPLASAQLLQPGTALVVYFTKAEAAQACDTYHNRLLDGQPMQCSLLPSSVSTGRSSLSSRLGGKLIPGSSAVPTSPPMSSFLPSASFQHSHSNLSAKSSHRSVQFTVKLP